MVLFTINMKKFLHSVLCLLCSASLSAASVTIDARDLKLYEEMAGFPLYILQMEAAGSTGQIRLQVHVTAEDYTGSYPINSDNSALVLPAGASAANATQATSGTIQISRPGGNILVSGSITCTNGTTYVLNLRTDPVPTRTETLTMNTLTLEDRILSEGEFQIYGENAAEDLYLQLTVFATMLEGTFTSNDIYKTMSMVRIKQSGSYVYFDVLSGTLHVQKDGNRVAVTGSIICQSENDRYDLPKYELYLSCTRDRKDDPMTGDVTDADFDAFFADYTLDTSEQALNGDIFVYARNADNQCVALDVYIAEGETEITPGVYPILQGTDLSNPYMTVHASEGIISGFYTPSYAGTLNAANEITSAWFIMAGAVTIDAAGRMEVNAINSAERTVHCILRGQPQGIENHSQRQGQSQKLLKDGHLFIRVDNRTYTIDGQRVE